MRDALESKDYSKAFDCAHTLKGVCGNLGLTPMYEIICRVVEALRTKQPELAKQEYGPLPAALETVKSLL